MGVDPQKVGRRIAGRKAATELLELVAKGDRADAVFMGAFVEALTKAVGQKPETVSALPSIGRLGTTAMPFGKHINRQFDDVPLAYLDWLLGQEESFKQDLKAYLTHPGLADHRRQAGSPDWELA